MGGSRGIAINEGIFLLESLSPVRLKQLRTDYPALDTALEIGIMAGPDEAADEKVAGQLLQEKAQVMIAALGEADDASRTALLRISRRVRSARRQRLTSQVLVLVGSSSSLATLALSKNRGAVVSAVLTLLAALWNLFAEYQEKLLNPQSGNIYDAFQRLAEGGYKARMMAGDLTLSLKYNQSVSDLGDLVASANKLCEDLNGWLIQVVGSVSPKGGDPFKGGRGH